MTIGTALDFKESKMEANERMTIANMFIMAVYH